MRGEAVENYVVTGTMKIITVHFVGPALVRIVNVDVVVVRMPSEKRSHVGKLWTETESEGRIGVLFFEGSGGDGGHDKVTPKTEIKPYGSHELCDLV